MRHHCEIAYEKFMLEIINGFPRHIWLVEHLNDAEAALLLAASKSAFTAGYIAVTGPSGKSGSYYTGSGTNLVLS